MQKLRRFLVVVSGLAILIAAVVASSASASAYGRANWQTAFSGNFNSPGASSGFWGWCAFFGGVTSGNDADCQVTMYFGGASTGTIHEAIHGTAWDTEPTLFPPPLAPAPDFFINAGSVTLTGSAVARLLGSGSPPPPGCTVSGGTVSCPIPVLEALNPPIYSPDTGIPAAPGHYSLEAFGDMAGFTIPPGTHINIQVNQLG